jgi:cytochrome b involved in lipid metabolism
MDITIVGGGIAGLYYAYLINKINNSGNKKIKTRLIEKSGRLGGRVYTYKTKHPITKEEIFYESGAGRVGSNHKLTMDLLKKANIGLYPIDPTINYWLDNKFYNQKEVIEKYLGKKTEFKTIGQIWKYAIDLFLKSSASQKRILKEINFLTGLKYLLSLNNSGDKKTYNPEAIVDLLTDTFGYISEIITMNAYDAFESFKEDFDVEKLDFYVAIGGLEQLINYLHNQLTNTSNKVPVEIGLRTTLNGIRKLKNKSYELEIINGEGKIEYMTTKMIVMAVEKSALMKIKYLEDYYPLFESVKAEPLLRIYAIYPPNKDGKVWFDGLPKIVSDTPIQFIIPINPKTGLIMISYTDNYFTGFWQSVLLENKTKTLLREYLSQMFPKREIPEPIYLNHHFYPEGAHYYLPGYDSKEIRSELIEMGKKENIWIIGETFSKHQAWIEGALETGLEVIKSMFGYSKTKLIGGDKKTFTMEEVKKHKTKKDAWIVIKNKVYDITKWIPKHPGGEAIMKGVGKDATELFMNNPAHSPSILVDILPKYYIGDLE